MPNTDTLAANHGQNRSRGRAVRSDSSMISMPVVSTPSRRVCSRPDACVVVLLMTASYDREGPSSSGGAPLDVVGVVALHPGHELAELATGLLDRVALGLLAELGELRRAVVHVGDEALGERTVLDVGEHVLHVLLHLRGDHARAGDVVAELGGVGDRPALLGDAALVHQVDDELELVEALEVGDLGLVAGLGQDLEAVLHELGGAAAEHGLLTEQVGLGLLGEGGPDAAGTQAADGLGVGEREVPGLAGLVLLHRDQDRHAAAVDVLATHEVAGALGGDHEDVDAVGRGDVAEADVEAVAEDEGVARGQRRLDLLGVELPLVLVGGEDHDQVGLLGRLARGEHAQALGLRLVAALRAGLQPDPDVDAGVAQGQRVGVALAAVADHRDVLALDQAQVGVVVVEHLSHWGLSFIVWCCGNVGGQVAIAETGAGTATGRWVRSLIEREPRPIATIPDCTSSRMPNGSSTRSRSASLSALPTAWTVTASGATSTTFARNSWTASSTAPRVAASARTLTSSSSRLTDPGPSSSTILMTSTSLLSCLVTCSSGDSSTLTTMVIRDTSGCSVGPTARESMLKPRRLNRPAMRASTPGLFSTRTLSVCLLMRSCSPCRRPRSPAPCPGRT